MWLGVGLIIELVLFVAAMLIGSAAGFVAGGFAAYVFLVPPGCVVPPELIVDPLIGSVLGAWYGPVVFNALSRTKPLRLSPTLHSFFDTSFGVVLGYHFAGGLSILAYEQFRIEGFLLGISLLAVCCGGLGWLFYWSTERWLKRMGQDEAGVERPLSIGLSHDR
jgi:hypothetical protein